MRPDASRRPPWAGKRLRGSGKSRFASMPLLTGEAFLLSSHGFLS